MSIETCWSMVQILAKKLSEITDCPSVMESVDFCNEDFCKNKTNEAQCWFKWAQEKSKKFKKNVDNKRER